MKPSIVTIIPEARGLPVGANLSVQMAVLNSRILAKEVLGAVPQSTLDELKKDNLQTDYWLALSNWVRRLLGKPPITISPRRRAISELRGARMTFSPLKKTGGRGLSGLMRISAVAFNPRVAVDMVNTYIQVLVNWSRRLEQEDIGATQKFFDLQLERVMEDLKRSETSLTAFEEEHGMVRLTDRTQFETARLVQLQGTLAQNQANQEVVRIRLDALKNTVERPEDASASEARAAAQAARRISARLVQLESQILQMETKYTEEHPSLVAAREELLNFRRQLAQLPVGNMPSSLAGDAPMRRDQIVQGIATLKADLAKLRTEEQSLILQIGHLRKSLQRLGGRETEYNQLRAAVGSHRALLSFMSGKLLAVRIREQNKGGVVKIIDPPILPTAPTEAVNPRLLAFLVAFALGTAGGVGFLVEYIYEPVETEETIRHQMAVPFLGWALPVPARQSEGNEQPLLVFNDRPGATLLQEFYRSIRTNLEAANLKSPFKAIMITSALPGEGKTTTAVNLALTLKELGRRVALVDADLRQPSLREVLPSKMRGGFVDLLRGEESVSSAPVPTNASLEIIGVQPDSEFVFVPGGDPAEDPAALLGSARAKELVEWFKQRWDYVLFDSPPLLLVSDNLLFAKFLDGVILVAHSGQTRKRDLHRAIHLLEESGVRILGVILNQVSPREIPYYYHRYRGYYAPYASRQSEKG
jgi:capsular exopolysaccharide synthesis family protein